MDSKTWSALNEVLDDVLDLKPDERFNYVRNHPDLDPQLKKQAIRFLESIRESTTFWENLIESNQSLLQALPHEPGSDFQSLDIEPDTEIGPYRIKKKIAAGGMGNVYLADRIDGHLQITVALKTIRRECVDDKHIHQFKTERNILAKMNHPGIAQIFDGGITDDGTPYLVMEFVKGVSLAAYCSQDMSTIIQKIDLFIQICEAVNFAHKNLVVHRDLKPDNILIKSNGRVKILDFGIAKILNPGGKTDTLNDKSGHLKPFSIQHAAPEQLSGDPITTATDVYALGLLLFDLLFEEAPYRLHGKTPNESLKIIRNYTFQSPDNSVHNDLCVILQACMAFNPDERYQSAGELVSDIKKFTLGQPISIFENNTLYKVKKFTGRNKGLITASSFMIILLLISTVYYISEINRERERAIQQEQRAAFISDFMVDLFNEADPARNTTDTLTFFDLLTTGREKMDQWTTNDQTKAGIMISLGKAHSSIGDYDNAKSLLEEAYQIINPDGSDQFTRQLLHTTLDLAGFYKDSRSFDSAAFMYDHALSLLTQQDQPNSQFLYRAYNGYADAITELGNAHLSLVYLEKARAISEASGDEDQFNFLLSSNFAKAYRGTGEYKKAESFYREILHNLPANPHIQTSRKTLINNNLAYLLKMQEKYNEAASHYSQALDLAKWLYGDKHPNTGIILTNLASVHMELGNHEKVLDYLTEHLDVNQATHGPEHWRSGSAYQSIGIYYMRTNKLLEAAPFFNKATEIFKDGLGADHIWTNRAILYHSLSRFNSSEHDLARKQFQVAIDILRENRNDFSRYDVELLNNLIRYIEPYNSITSTPEFAMLKEIQ